MGAVGCVLEAAGSTRIGEAGERKGRKAAHRRSLADTRGGFRSLLAAREAGRIDWRRCPEPWEG